MKKIIKNRVAIFSITILAAIIVILSFLTLYHHIVFVQAVPIHSQEKNELYKTLETSITNIKNNLEQLGLSPDITQTVSLVPNKKLDEQTQDFFNSIAANTTLCYQSYAVYDGLKLLKEAKNKDTITVEEFDVLSRNVWNSNCLQNFGMYDYIVIHDDPKKAQELYLVVKPLLIMKNVTRADAITSTYYLYNNAFALNSSFHGESALYYDYIRLLEHEVRKYQLVEYISEWLLFNYQS